VIKIINKKIILFLVLISIFIVACNSKFMVKEADTTQEVEPPIEPVAAQQEPEQQEAQQVPQEAKTNQVPIEPQEKTVLENPTPKIPRCEQNTVHNTTGTFDCSELGSKCMEKGNNAGCNFAQINSKQYDQSKCVKSALVYNFTGLYACNTALGFNCVREYTTTYCKES
jgi:PBP1b-binding outer membrane lipoprotein LpoB